jgi:hypothetical protein
MRIILLQIIIQLVVHQSSFSQKKIDWIIYDRDFNKVAKISTTTLSIQNDLIWYKTGKGFGVMNLHREILIKPKYDEIMHYSGGLTAAGNKGCFTMVYEGKEILPPEYDRHFTVDGSGYFTANHGCSEKPGAYIITTKSIHDKTGKLISTGCEDDIQKLFRTITKGNPKPSYNEKKVSNGFTIKLIQSNERYARKGVYNSKDSLIFSCSACRISDNLDGEFFIYQKDVNKPRQDEAYCIDTTGAIKMRGGYDRMSYDQKHGRYLYKKGNEHGFITKSGAEQILVKTSGLLPVIPISKNRFLLSIRDSLNNPFFTICDSLGVYLFTPTKDAYHVIGNNCLIRRSSGGYMFTDNNGKPVSNMYDSTYQAPDFNYKKMVLGGDYAGLWLGRMFTQLRL